MLRLFLCIAVLPAAVLLYHVYSKDKLEKEPASLLIKLLVFGALCGIPAAFLEALADLIMPNGISPVLYAFIEFFFVVAIAEEGCKYLIMRVSTWNDREFNCSFDGLVYSVYVSMGFAVLENILYILRFGLGVGVIRAFTAIPGHAFFAVFMGVHYGKAKYAANMGRKDESRMETLKGLGFAMLAHGAYDFLADISGVVTIIPFIILLVALYVLGSRAINAASENDRYILPFNGMIGNVSPLWTCFFCGNTNQGTFCSRCGKPKYSDPLPPNQYNPYRNNYRQ